MFMYNYLDYLNIIVFVFFFVRDYFYFIFLIFLKYVFNGNEIVFLKKLDNCSLLCIEER